MTALAALTEEVHRHWLTMSGTSTAVCTCGEFEWHGIAKGSHLRDFSRHVAAAILAHPAMTDLARKAAIGDAVDALDGITGPLYITRWHPDDWEVRSYAQSIKVSGATLEAAIAAALEQGDDPRA